MPPSKSPSSDPHSIPLLYSNPQNDEEQQRTDLNQPLYPPHPPPKRSLVNRYSWIVAVILLLIFIGLLAVPKPISHKLGDIEDDYDEDAPIPDPSGICKQLHMKQLPDDDISRDLETALGSEDYLRGSVQRLSGAIQIPTESFDDMGPVGEDPRWESFQEFHNYLEKIYPYVYSKLKVEKVNTWGLLYTWNGSNTELKPILFMAHQDVVPVPRITLRDWKYSPWSGHYYGERIWGRGANDCKNNLLGVLDALEFLLERNFEPKRTILAGFGFDEEISGPQGAAYISDHLLKRYGKDSFEFIIDEGGSEVREMYGGTFALPGTAEKGYLDVKITVSGQGGHSSVPPEHTTIGQLAQIINLIEKNPWEPVLSNKSPFFGTLQCVAVHSKNISSHLKNDILRAGGDNKKVAQKSMARVIREFRKIPSQRYLMGTSQAVDIIDGGVKVNALPESVYALVNHRIAMESSVKEVQNHLTDLLVPLVKSLPANFIAFDKKIYSPSRSDNPRNTTITLSTTSDTLNPAPVSPETSYAWGVLASTVQHVFGEHVVLAPSLMTGNTDTKFYWGLSRDIWRFTPIKENGRGNAHTVDEFVGAKDHVEIFGFYVKLIRGADSGD